MNIYDISQDIFGAFLGMSCYFNSRYPFYLNRRYLLNLPVHFLRPQLEDILLAKVITATVHLVGGILDATLPRRRPDTLKNVYAT